MNTTNNPLLGAVLLLAFQLAHSAASAVTFTVTTTADSGEGSLRQAILDANAHAGPDAIRFNIPAPGVQTINPLTPPPLITDIVHIDGYTQPGAALATTTSGATILIELSGDLLPGGPGVNGLTLAAGSSGSSIRGLSINRFKRVVTGTGHAILVTAGSGSHWIAGNHLNVAPDGSTVFTGSPSFGDGYDDAGAGHNIIGHDASGPNRANPAADRNIISGSGDARPGLVMVATSAGNQIRGNYIGTDASGALDRGNSLDGIQLQSGGNIVENNVISGNNRFGIITFTNGTSDGNVIRNNHLGTDASGTLDVGNSNAGMQLQAGGNVIENNLVSANGTVGIRLVAFGNNSVTGNKIGTDVSGTFNLGNKAVAGIQILGGSGANSIGGLGDGDGNIIAFNPVGVAVGPAAAPGNTILGNCIVRNLGLGIDLGRDGVTLNDALDADVGNNDLQNCPVINGQRSFMNPALVQVWGSLESKPNQPYLIQLFSSAVADISGYGEGQQLVGNVAVRTDAAGHAEFHLPAKVSAAVGSILSATATDLLTGDTSEFSKWENAHKKGSPTAYDHAAGAAGGDGHQRRPHLEGDVEDGHAPAKAPAGE